MLSLSYERKAGVVLTWGWRQSVDSVCRNINQLLHEIVCVTFLRASLLPITSEAALLLWVFFPERKPIQIRGETSSSHLRASSNNDDGAYIFCVTEYGMEHVQFLFTSLRLTQVSRLAI